MSFDLVKERIPEAKAIAWDTCHKIYLLLDDEQVEITRGYGYDPLITSEEATPDEMMRKVEEWYDNSCSLRFINAVRTNHADPNAGFEQLIPQFFGQEEGEDDEA